MKTTTSIVLPARVTSALTALAALTLMGCPPARESNVQDVVSLDAISESYVKLVLAVGQHDDGYVDAYYGPPEWLEAAASRARPLEEIRDEARRLLERFPPPATDEMLALRRGFLERQLSSLVARTEMLEGKWLTFDEESEALYDARAPVKQEAHFERVLAELDGLLADEGLSDGSVIERYETFRQAFIIPAERLDEVFRTAIEACRERTAGRIDLPEGESFELEYVTDKTWSAYNWYQGNYTSLIQVNTDLPVYVDRVLDLACHEGYPGHHVYNALLEKHLVEERGWVEYVVYPLFSPQSLIAEGSANFGIEMAFPGGERLSYERDVLFPLAGLDPERAAAYDATRQLVSQLGYGSNEAARRYLDGEIDAAKAAEWLTRYAAMSPALAEQRVGFISQYRSYVINYNLGLDLVRDYVDRETGLDGVSEKRWEVFTALLSSPRLPSGLQ